MAGYADSNEGWRAGIQQNYHGGGLRVCLVQLIGDDQMKVVESLSTAGGTSNIRERHTEADFFYVPEGAARALLDALSLHFGGTGDTRQLRRDFDAERGRVDKLTDALIAVATRNGPGA